MANTNSLDLILRIKHYSLYEYEGAYPFYETSISFKKNEMIDTRHLELHNLSSSLLFLLINPLLDRVP